MQHLLILLLLCIFCITQSYLPKATNRKIRILQLLLFKRDGEESKPQSISQNAKSSCLGTMFFISLCLPSSAFAAKGAFEMDAEFYLDNILNRNSAKKTQIKKDKDYRKPIYKTPRKIDRNTAISIIERIEKSICALSPKPLSITDLRKNVALNMPATLIFFKKFVPIVCEDLSDQYYFDINLYLLYKEAEIVMSDSEKRVKFRKEVGESILELIPSSKIANSASNINMKEVAAGIQNVLNFFVKTRIISSYEFDQNDFADDIFANQSFDQKLPISFQITLKEPANLLSFLEGYSANNFFHPEIFATTIAAYLRKIGFYSKFEDYLLDNYYRESNFDLQAQDVIIEMQLIPKQVAGKSFVDFNT